jgi:hypothetical protein
MPKTTKLEQVKQHLLKHQTISSLQAIKLYNATRLSAIIFTLRKKQGWDITTTPISILDCNQNPCTYGLYTLISQPNESQLQKKFDNKVVE